MKNHSSIFILLVCLTVLLAVMIALANATLAAPDATLQVSFIDVGQGDSALIHDSTNFDVLIDGGNLAAGPTVAAYIKQEGIDDIDVMVASHPDSDHIEGLISVLNDTAIPVEAVYYNGYPGGTITWNNFEAAVTNKGLSLISAQFPQSFTWGDMTAYILNPDAGLVTPDTNNASIVLLIVYGNTRFLFTGDIDPTIENAILAKNTPVAADLLKVAHHGSKDGSSSPFLSAVSPKEAVISVGENSYGHPAQETINRLFGSGARIWRTDYSGTIQVWTDGVTYGIVNPPFSLEPAVFLPLILSSSALPMNDVRITSIHYDGAGSVEPDEYVVIRNYDSHSVQLQQWSLKDNANHTFTFPSYMLQPGQECRIYTNEYHADSCGFNYENATAIWNNGGDCAYLNDSQGNLVSKYCYP